MTLTKRDLDELEEIFVTKSDFTDYRSELMNKLDKILKEILTSREEQTILTHQVSNNEDRIVTLEKTATS